MTTSKITTAETGVAGSSPASGSNVGGDTIDLISKSAGGSITIDNTAGRTIHGNQCFRFTTAATSDTAILGFTVADSLKTASIQFDYRFDALPAAAHTIAHIRHASGVIIGMTLNANGTLNVSTGGTASSVLSANTNYRIGLYINLGTTGTGDSTITWAVYAGDNTTAISTVTTTTASLGTNVIAAARIGKLSGSEATTIAENYDNFHLSTGATGLLPVEPTVQPLVASATPSISVGVGLSQQMTGSATGGTAPYTYSWAPLSSQGGAAATLTNGSTATATITPSASGVLTYRVTVTDAAAATSTAQTIAYVPAATVGPLSVTANVGAWTTTGAADAATALADALATTYTQSPDSPTSASTVRVRLAPMVSGTGFSLLVDHQLTNTATGTATVTLYEGSTVRKSWALTPTTALQTANLTLTSAELATITSLNALDIEFAWNV